MQARGASAVFVALLACCAPSPARPAEARVLRVAYLSTLSREDASARIEAVGKRLEARWPAASRPGGAQIEYRVFAFQGQPTGLASPPAERARIDERIGAANRASIAEMLAWKPDVIFAPGAGPAKAAAQSTATTPIVFGCKCNPLADGWGLVKDPARPERNLTGFTRYHFDMVGPDPARRVNLQRKRIELLRLASGAPVRRIGAIHGDAFDEAKWRYRESARELGVEWVPLRLDESSIEQLPERIREHAIDAAIVLADDFADAFRGRLVKAAAASPVPVMFPWDEADAGAWMHYGTVVDFSDKAAEYIANILQGRKVIEYPVEFPKRMELAVNMRTAKAHGWQFPRGFLLLVDRAIE